MANETKTLADYAASVRFRDLPEPVVQRAKDCIADTVATIALGADFPWSRAVMDYAERMGAGGKSRILAPGGAAVQPPFAALANGALAHAFELDNLTWPSTGVHPGATLLSSLLAVAQQRGLGGRELLTAFVAGSEAMIRIGRATKHSNEGRGFHAPGTTGPFGAAIAVGRLLKFDADRMVNAMGIAGSLAGGLMEFAKSGTGAMVKRLHLGRAAESGVLAAHLAENDFTGPTTVLEGPFGFLNVFCTDRNVSALTEALGTRYPTLTIMLKRFPCHITAHTSVQATTDMMREHQYTADDVESIYIEGNDKMANINNIQAPADLMMAQYAIPFCVALAHYRDPRDPRSFNDEAVHDPDIRALARRVSIANPSGAIGRTLECFMRVTLKDGRTFERRVEDFKGTPASPLNRAELREKFMLLTSHCDPTAMSELFERLMQIENERDLSWIAVPEAVTQRKAASA